MTDLPRVGVTTVAPESPPEIRSMKDDNLVCSRTLNPVRQPVSDIGMWWYYLRLLDNSSAANVSTGKA
jgi:hypothetical protein